MGAARNLTQFFGDAAPHSVVSIQSGIFVNHREGRYRPRSKGSYPRFLGRKLPASGCLSASKPCSFSEVDRKPLTAPLVAPRHLGGRVAELALYVRLVGDG